MLKSLFLVNRIELFMASKVYPKKADILGRWYQPTAFHSQPAQELLPVKLVHGKDSTTSKPSKGASPTKDLSIGYTDSTHDRARALGTDVPFMYIY